LAKPELGDLSEKERFQKLWQVNTEQMNAILKVSSEAKSILVDLFAANERNIQRGFWRYVGSSKRHRKETEEAAQRQDLVHKQLLATFASEEELVAKMKTIASLRITDEEWADRRCELMLEHDFFLYEIWAEDAECDDTSQPSTISV
jgi:hypothetical protein